MSMKTKEIIYTILSAACAVVVITASIVAGFFLLPEFPSLWIPLCVACLVLLIACAAVNLVGLRKFKRRFDNKTAREIYNYGLEMQKSVEEDFKAAEREAHRKIGQGNAWLALLIVLTVLLFVFLGATRAEWSALAGIVGAYLLTGLFENFIVPSEKTPHRLFLSAKEYPLIFAQVQRAAEAAGCHRKLRTELVSEGIGVREEGAEICIGLDATECALLTGGELYAVMLHEFAHVVNVDTARGRRFYRARRRWVERRDDLFSGVASLFLSSFAMQILFASETYRMFATRHHEILADEKVIELGQSRAFIDATAKGTELSLYNDLPQRETSYDCYEPEEVPQDLVSRDLKNFFAYREKYGEMWRKIMREELPARVSTHPTLRQRMEKMQVSEYDDSQTESDEKYRGEQQKLLQFADKMVCESLRPHYAAVREDAYVSRKEQMEKYDAAAAEGKELPLDEQVLCMQAFYGIDDEKAMQIADKMLEKDANAAYAHLYRAKIWFDRMDERCVEEFRAAMRSNRDLTDSCLDHIGLFALRSGNEQLLQEYRSNAPELSQEAEDRSAATHWKKGTELRDCGLPEEVMGEIRARIGEISEGSVLRVYAADFGEPACTAIAVEMKKRVLPAEQARLMNTLCAYLDSRSEDYVLYLYAGKMKAAMEEMSLQPFYTQKQ